MNIASLSVFLLDYVRSSVNQINISQLLEAFRTNLYVRRMETFIWRIVLKSLSTLFRIEIRKFYYIL